APMVSSPAMYSLMGKYMVGVMTKLRTSPTGIKILACEKTCCSNGLRGFLRDPHTTVRRRFGTCGVVSGPNCCGSTIMRVFVSYGVGCSSSSTVRPHDGMSYPIEV